MREVIKQLIENHGMTINDYWVDRAIPLKDWGEFEVTLKLMGMDYYPYEGYISLYEAK